MTTVATNCSTFTLFASTCMTSYQLKTGVAIDDHVTLIAPDSELQQYPRIWVMDAACSKVAITDTVRIAANASEA